MAFLTGILAALAAPLVMTVGFIVWDNHWAGSPFSLNLYKCNLASIGFVVLSAATRPDDPFGSAVFQRRNVGFLMLSSVIGILIGDVLWLEGLRLLGARRVIVMDSLKPFLAALFGWALLGEDLRLGALGGIVLTVVGILLVSWDDEQQQESPETQIAEEKEETSEKVGNEDIQISSVNGGKGLANPDVEASAHTIATTAAEKSSLFLAAGSFPGPPGTELYVVEDNVELSLSQNRPTGLDSETTVLKNTVLTITEAESTPNKRQSLTNADKRAQTRQQLVWGYSMVIINVVLDTYGSVLTKEYGTEFTTWEINLIRFGFAGLLMAMGSLVLVGRDRCLYGCHGNSERAADSEEEAKGQPKWYQLPTATMSRSAWAHVTLGVGLVTFVTPAISTYALFQIALALALTLGSVGPLYALPLTYLMQRREHTKRPSLRACFGALLAVAGIVVLAFRGTLE